MANYDPTKTKLDPATHPYQGGGKTMTLTMVCTIVVPDDRDMETVMNHLLSTMAVGTQDRFESFVKRAANILPVRADGLPFGQTFERSGAIVNHDREGFFAAINNVPDLLEQSEAGKTETGGDPT